MGTHSFSSHSTIYIMNFKLFLALFALSAALIMADETGGKKETDDGEQNQEDDTSDETDGGNKKDDDKKDDADAKLKCWKSDAKGENNKKNQECTAEEKLCQSLTKGKVTVKSCATTCAEASAEQAVYCCG